MINPKAFSYRTHEPRDLSTKLLFCIFKLSRKRVEHISIVKCVVHFIEKRAVKLGSKLPQNWYFQFSSYQRVEGRIVFGVIGPFLLIFQSSLSGKIHIWCPYLKSLFNNHPYI